MLGTSLPFHWLLAGGAPLGDVPTVLNTLKAHGVESVELRTVNPNTNPDDVLYAANLLWDAGFVITVHAAPKSVERAVDDVFIPLTALLDHLRQEKLTVVVHPDFDDNAALLTTLADHRDAHGCPIVFALENNRLLPGKVDGDCAALVLDAVKNVRAAGYRDIGICFDFGHYLYYWNIRGICGNGIVDIGVLVQIVSVILPDTGNGNGVKSSGIKAFLEETLGQLTDAGIVTELPVCAEQLETVRVCTVFHKIISSCGSGDIVCAVGHGVLVENLQIFKMCWHDHCRILLV